MSYKNYGTVICDERIPLYPKRITRVYEGPKLLGLCKTSFLFSVFLFVYVMFLCSGAAIFSLLEAPEEQSIRMKVDAAFQKFFTLYPNVSGNTNVAY